METLLARHHDLVRTVCARIVGSGADLEDTTQEALLAVFRGLRSFDGRSSFTTWLWRVATNAALDELRRRRRWPVPHCEEPDPSPRRFDSVAEGTAARVDVTRALELLPLEFRVCVLLRDLVGLSYDEIAETLDIPPGTVRSRIARGRAQLVDLLCADAGDSRRAGLTATRDSGATRREGCEEPQIGLGRQTPARPGNAEVEP